MKEHLKNLSLIMLLLLISSQFIKAQTEKVTSIKVPEYIQNADYVFEGTAVDVTGYWTTIENGNRVIYTSLLVEVSNVFKGNGIKKGLIQVIVQGGSAPLENDPELIGIAEYYGSHDERIPIFTQKGTKGIIFGKSVPNKMGYDWNKKLENSIVIEHKKALLYCVECSYEKFDNLQTDWGTFNNLSQLRKSIKSFNLQTDFVDRTDSIEDSIATIQKEQELKKIEEDNIKMSKIVEEAKAREALMIQGKQLAAQEAEAKKKVTPNLKLAAGGNLNLDLRNFAYSTVSGLNYVEFDVYVWGTQSTFLEGTLFRLNFDKHAFGDSTYVKNYLTASKGTSFNNINYKIYGPFYIEDSVVAINFSTNDSLVRPNRIAVSTTPLQLVHLKFRVKNCQATAKMKFVDPVICDILTGFKLNSNDSIAGPVQSYDNVFRTDYSPIPLCPTPTITGFSPSVIRAGTNEVLTITGTNFGATRGNGQILFADADSIGRYFKRCDSIDYVSWTNTEIRVKVPSLVLSDTLRPTAGSGIFKIVTNQGFRDSTTTKLDVQYSLLNSSSAGSSIKRRLNLAYYNCNNNTRTFYLGNSLSSYPQAVTLIDSAINAWARFLRIDIRLQKDNYNGYQYFADNNVQLDTASIIYVKTFPVGTSTLMSTSNYSLSCSNYVLNAGADIAINMNTTWHYGFNDTKPSGTNDFYQSILHEIGHALGLDHTINPNATTPSTEQLDLMTYAQTSNIQKLASERATLETGRQMAKVGSLNIRDTSKTISWACSTIKKVREFSSPSSKKTCIGTSTSFTTFISVPAGSPTPTYQWQTLSSVGGGTWVSATTSSLGTTVNGTNTATMTIPSPIASLNGRPFRCRISNVDGCIIYTQVAILSFNTPIFWANPTNQTINENTNRNLPAESANVIDYKWQQKLAGSSVYNDLSDGTHFSGTSSTVLTIINTPYSYDQSYFRCKGTNSEGCIGYSSAAKITVNPTGFAPTNPTNNIITSNLKATIFPNPSNNSVNINLNESKLIKNIVVLNSNGDIVLSNDFNTNTATIDISNFSNGLYILKISDGNSEITKEIVITH